MIVNTNREFNSMVPTSFVWRRNKTPKMILNLGWYLFNDPNSSYDNVSLAAAHEFGHVLGIFDAYPYFLTKEADSAKAPSNGVMRSKWYNKPIINDTEIAMMLYAFSRDKLQNYEYTAYSGEESTVFYQ